MDPCFHEEACSNSIPPNEDLNSDDDASLTQGSCPTSILSSVDEQMTLPTSIASLGDLLEMGNRTVIPHTKGTYFRYHDEEVPEPIKKIYDVIVQAFWEAVHCDKGDLVLAENRHNIVFSLWMAGPSRGMPVPTMLVSYKFDRQLDLGRRIEKILTRASVRRVYEKRGSSYHHCTRNLNIVYRATPYPPAELTANDSRNIYDFDDTATSICGARITISGRDVTATLNLDVDGTTYLLVPGHVFPKCQPEIRKFASTSPYGGEQDELDETLAWEYESTDDGHSDDHFTGYPGLGVSAISFEDIDDKIDAERSLDSENSHCMLRDKPGTVSVFHQHQSSFRATNLVAFDASDWHKVVWPGSGDSTSPGSDWALLKHDVLSEMPNMILPNDFGGPVRLDTIAASIPLTSVDVVMVSGVYGIRPGRLATGWSHISEAHDIGLIEVKTINLIDGRGVSKGESGSLVVVAETWEIIGSVIASDCEGGGFVQPLQPVLDQIKSQLQAREVKLPKDLTFGLPQHNTDPAWPNSYFRPANLPCGQTSCTRDFSTYVPFSRHKMCLECRLRHKRESDDIHHPLLHVAVSLGDVDTARLLLEKGAKVDTVSGNGWTPLHFAAYMGNAKCVSLLWESGANVDYQDYYGSTALHEACRAFNRSALLPSASQEWLKFNLARSSLRPDCQDDKSFEEQYSDRLPAHKEVVRSLLSRGASAHQEDFRGITPLALAVNRGIPELIEILLGHKNTLRPYRAMTSSMDHDLCFQRPTTTEFSETRFQVDAMRVLHPKNGGTQVEIHSSRRSSAKKNCGPDTAVSMCLERASGSTSRNGPAQTHCVEVSIRRWKDCALPSSLFNYLLSLEKYSPTSNGKIGSSIRESSPLPIVVGHSVGGSIAISAISLISKLLRTFRRTLLIFNTLCETSRSSNKAWPLYDVQKLLQELHQRLSNFLQKSTILTSLQELTMRAYLRELLASLSLLNPKLILLVLHGTDETELAWTRTLTPKKFGGVPAIRLRKAPLWTVLREDIRRLLILQIIILSRVCP